MFSSSLQLMLLLPSACPTKAQGAPAGRGWRLPATRIVDRSIRMPMPVALCPSQLYLSVHSGGYQGRGGAPVATDAASARGGGSPPLETVVTYAALSVLCGRGAPPLPPRHVELRSVAADLGGAMHYDMDWTAPSALSSARRRTASRTSCAHHALRHSDGRQGRLDSRGR